MRDEMIQANAGKYIITHTYGSDKKSDPILAAILDISIEEVDRLRKEELSKIHKSRKGYFRTKKLARSYDLTMQQMMDAIMMANPDFTDEQKKSILASVTETTATLLGEEKSK